MFEINRIKVISRLMQTNRSRKRFVNRNVISHKIKIQLGCVMFFNKTRQKIEISIAPKYVKS